MPDETTVALAKPALQPSPLHLLLADPERFKDYPVDVVERMFAIDKEIRREEAKKEFFYAFHALQKKLKPVKKKGWNKHTRSHYAFIEDISAMADPILSEHGFSPSLGSQECPHPEHVRAVLVLRHNGGYEERHVMDAPVGTGGPKGGAVMSKIQGMVTAMSYCKRVLFCNVLNINLVADDGDGNSPEMDAKITEDQARDLEALCAEVGGNVEKFNEIFGVESFADLARANLKPAIQLLEAKRK